MAQILTCSQCKATLSVPDDMLGKLVRCPSCSITFQAPQTFVQPIPEPLPARTEPPPFPEAPGRDELPSSDQRRERNPSDWADVELLRPDARPADDRDDRGRRRGRREYDDDGDFPSDRDYEPRRRIDPAWLTVKSGLNAMFIGSMVVVGTAVVCFLLIMIIVISQQGGGRRNNDAIGIMAGGLTCLGILVALGGGITSLVGRFMSLATPDARSRGFMVGHLIFLAINSVLAVILFVVFVAMVESRNPGDRRGVQVAMGLLGSLEILIFLVSAIFLNLFLKGVALSFNNTTLAGGCTAFLVFETFWLLGATGLSLLSMGLEPNNFAQEGRMIAWVLGTVIIGGGGGLVALIWNMVLVRGCHNAIRQAQGNTRKRFYD